MTTQLQLQMTVPGAVDPQAGERAKTDGMTAASRATAPSWAAACDAAIRLMARRGIAFQAADLIAEGLVDEPEHSAQWGPRFAVAARAGIIRLHSYGPSKRATVHRSICKTWIGNGGAS